MRQAIVAIIRSRNEQNQETFLLISANKEYGKYTHFYYPPGGHLEPGESKKEALIREIKEELNMTVKPIREVYISSGDVEEQTIYWWECEVVDGTMHINNDELYAAGFFTKEQINDLPLWPLTRKFFTEYIFH